ncbi:MAG: DUF1778 domain-containing protein [Alphaproteobacteria bacterium]
MRATLDAAGSGARSDRKRERLAVRLSGAAKRTLERAAEVSGRSLSDFVVASALDAAHQTIEEHDRIRLAAEDRAVFLAALANPPEPGEALRSAVAHYEALRK